jgi:protein-tyrosine-phosphatase/predicted ATP-grasp superfamily ATP-dependent carboligase
MDPTALTPRALRILVTDAHELASLGAVRSLGRAGHRVVAAYPERRGRPAGEWSRRCAATRACPDPWRDHLEFCAWVADQARSGDFDAILPITEASLVAVATVRAEVARDVLLIAPEDAALRVTLSKYLATRLARSLGVPCPRTLFLGEEERRGTTPAEVASLGFPLIIKTDNYLAAEGVYLKGEGIVVPDLRDLERRLLELETLPTAAIAQEVVPGHGAGAFFLRFGGVTHLRFAHRRLHEVPYTGGFSSLRESAHDEALTALGDRLLAGIDYDGVAMVEFRRRAADGRPFFLEINGRLWGSLALALHCGVDFPRALVECYQLGAPASPARAYRAGVRCRNTFPGEIAHVLSILRSGAGAGGTGPRPSKLRALASFVLLSLDPRVRHDHFWWTDPIPGAIQALQVTRSLLAGLASRVRHRLGRARARRRLGSALARHRACGRAAPPFPRGHGRVLFLCYGNIARSAFAERYWNARREREPAGAPVARSAGLHARSGRPTPRWIAAVASGLGVDLGGHASSVVSGDDVESADVIFVMDADNLDLLLERFPSAEAKTYLLAPFAEDGSLEIPDPYNLTNAEARASFALLRRSLDALLARLRRPSAVPRSARSSTG